MNSYLYPTEPHWFDDELKKWKSSGKRYFCFPFLWFEPHTLPSDKTKEFWLYLYYAESRTDNQSLQRVVQFRAKVIETSLSKIKGNDIHLLENDEAKTYFKCDVVEEIKTVDGKFLTEADFNHAQGKNLLSSIRNSVAPIIRKTPMITVQKTMYWLND
ncbi:hypothetical protein P4E94_08890 [Pontiellaceae bacterium B12219]|nr:hypothetical protein [Pontiellaceae bacterium B12219]